jgi:hypothetical protein
VQLQADELASGLVDLQLAHLTSRVPLLLLLTALRPTRSLRPCKTLPAVGAAPLHGRGALDGHRVGAQAADAATGRMDCPPVVASASVASPDDPAQPGQAWFFFTSKLQGCGSR